MKRYLNFEEARMLVMELEISSKDDYESYVKENPNCGLPLNPEEVYKDRKEKIENILKEL